MSNTTLLVTLAKPEPDQAEVFHGYVEASTQLALEAGGEVSSRFGVRHIHGDAPAVVFGLATFPSVQAVSDMFAAPEYQSLIPARDKSIEHVNAYTVADTPITALADLDGDGVYLVTVAAPNPDGAEALATYQQAVGPLFSRHGAAPVAQLPVSDHPVGETPAGFIGVVTFPSAQAVDALFADPDYLAVVDARNEGLLALNLYVTT
ncbi:MAG: DUF1330 domain-containing protein [Actinomycetota bacterium]